MALAPIDQVIEIKPRPQTTLQLLAAIEDPVGTITDYVFTPSIKEHFCLLLQDLGSGYGGGYWALSEYGGGKTHFLATLASMLSATDQVVQHVTDPEVQLSIQQMTNQRLFPVAFNLIGRSDMLSQRNALFRILEEEIQRVAHRLLDAEITLTLPEEVKSWWNDLGVGTRSDIAERYQELFGASPDDDYEDSTARWADQVAECAAALGIRIVVSSTPVDRLAAIYRQVVNEHTGYTGLLIVMDEFASWQDQRPEGGSAYSEDENLLQTLAETLPRDRDLNVFTVVASQKPMPRKFEGGRFRQFDLLRPSDEGRSPSIEYAMVVASRVRDIAEFRAPEIEEYHEYYRTRFNFARSLSLSDFNAIFPMQPLSFDVLRRITSNLTSARTGINVLWDVLGQGDPVRPELRSGLADTRRLITASDLLDSTTLDQDLRQSVRYGTAYVAYQQAIEQVERLAARSQLFQEDVSTAKAVVRTLFLWHCSRDGQMNITLDEMTEAVLPDEGFLDSPQDNLLSVLGSMEDVSQIKFDSSEGELHFDADVIVGRSGADVFDDYRARFMDPSTLELNWQTHLTNPNLSVGTLSAILGGLETGIYTKRTATYRGINYDGEMVATADWFDGLGVQLPFDCHFRLVFMLRDDMTVTPDVLDDDRTLVLFPGSLSAENREAMTDILALDQMQEDYRHRQDDEALRVDQFVNSRQGDLRIALLMAQRDFYKRGRIISRTEIALNPDSVFGPDSDLLGRVITRLFDTLFVHRPLGTFRRNRTMNLNTETSRVFTGLWEREPERSVRNALENFAVGLGLTQHDNPLRYDPSGCGSFDIIRSMYLDSQARELPLQVPEIYEQLARVGIPARLATLYLLCYVRSNTDVELLLKSGHRIRLIGGGQPQGDRIHSNVVPRIEWNNRAFATTSSFDVLVERKGVVWNDCLEWTRKFAPNLQAATDPQHVEEQTRQLLNSLKAEQERLQNANDQIRALELLLTGNIPSSIRASADLVHGLTRSSSLEEFMATVDSANSVDTDDLGRAVTDAHNLCQLAQTSVEIISGYTYLNSVPAYRLDGELVRLGEDGTALIGAIDLSSLALSPGQWPRIWDRFNTWKRVYVREYRKFHRDFHVETSKLRQRLVEIDQKLVALENVEQVKQIAPANLAPELRSQLQSMLGGLKECDPSIEAGDLEATPHCIRCSVRVGDLPAHDPSSLESQITESLDELIGTLRSEVIDKALAGSESPIITELREFLRSTETHAVINILKDMGNVDLLRGILEGEIANLVIVRDVNIVGELSKEYPTVSKESIQEVADRFHELMEEALKTQQKDVGPSVRVEVRLH